MANRDGFVSCSIPGLIRAVNITQDEFKQGIKTLESPDSYSRTPDFDGRRIEKVDGGWIVLNFLKYREHSEIIKEQTKERVRKFREKQEKKHNVTHGNVTETLPSASASASVCINSSEGDSKGETWRESYEIYEKQASDAYDRLIANTEWITEQQSYYPGMDIFQSLRKAFNNFWGLKAGWEHKKKKSKGEIDWNMTFANALSLKGNQVWPPKPIRR